VRRFAAQAFAVVGVRRLAVNYMFRRNMLKNNVTNQKKLKKTNMP
jgi:hypothetical protein